MIFTSTFTAALASAPDVDVLVDARVDVESGSDSLLELRIRHTSVVVRLSDLDEPTGREIAEWVSDREEQYQDYIAERIAHERGVAAFERGDSPSESEERYVRWFGKGAI